MAKQLILFDKSRTVSRIAQNGQGNVDKAGVGSAWSCEDKQRLRLDQKKAEEDASIKREALKRKPVSSNKK